MHGLYSCVQAASKGETEAHTKCHAAAGQEAVQLLLAAWPKLGVGLGPEVAHAAAAT